MRGFESYNNFKSAIKDLKQLYDITYHLYQTETVHLENELHDENPRNNLNTSVGAIDHNLFSLSQRLKNSYPFKLRQLVLISTITSLEVYLTDIILEIFQRDMTPFKLEEPITYQRNFIFSLSSIDILKDQLVKKDFRNLTSGGLKEVVKYYLKSFNIDLKNLGISFEEIEEIHIRRHLFVHRNGVVDYEYSTKFPNQNYKVGDSIKISHEYLLESLNKISEFAGLINKQFLSKYPDITRHPKYVMGEAKQLTEKSKSFMLELNLLDEKFDHVDFFQNLNSNGTRFMEIVKQMATVDSTCYLFLQGEQKNISKFYRTLLSNKSFSINRSLNLNP